jgi:Kef-type K+ transport system membrane component KefB
MHIPSATLVFLAAIFGLLVVPRALQRFLLPAPLTCFVLGIATAVLFKDQLEGIALKVMATLGISSLFLFAGLEVDMVEIRRQLPRLAGHLAIRGLFLFGFGWVAMRYLHMTWQPAALLALGLLTPSTGFILDTLPHSGLKESEQNEVAMDAIAGEITALVVLFLISQASSIQTLAVSSTVLLLLIIITPFFYLALKKYVVPYAPGSEFSLLLMVGIICAVITNQLGVHYLIGAFVAGLVAGLMRKRMTTMASPENLHAVRLFASFFVPFYFFREGLEVPTGALVVKALLYGVAFAAVVLPIRIVKGWLQVRYLSGRSIRGGFRVSLALLPTLIFTLVIAGILRDIFQINDALYGGLLVYAAIATILPSFLLPRVTPRMLAVIATEAGA